MRVGVVMVKCVLTDLVPTHVHVHVDLELGLHHENA